MDQNSLIPSGGGSTDRTGPAGLAAPGTAPRTREIPYDYVATFDLEGQAGHRVQDVINISVEGAFVAVSIGYSFIPGPLPDRIEDSADVPDLIGKLLGDIGVDQRVAARCLFAKLCGIDFKYTILDSGSGRELQNRPIHNLAGLGESTGDRPFRPLPKPMVFRPRSTIRLEVEELSEGAIYRGAELSIVLHGYKILGAGTELPQ